MLTTSDAIVRRRSAGPALGSQPTLSRFENGLSRRDLVRVGQDLARTVIAHHRRRLHGRARRITIDLDPTDDPTHGQQELSFFNGHYDTACYLPLVATVTFDDEPMQYLVGIDGISLWLVLLTTFLFPISVLASWTVQTDVRRYMLAMLALETAVVGSFLALDLIVFFIFFEALLVPMYLLIGGWGGERRVYAAMKFFLYTMVGSAFLLVAILFLYSKANAAGAGTFDLRALADTAATLPVETARFRPYVAGGIGINDTSQRFTLSATSFTPAIDRSTSHTGLAFRGGGGASIRLAGQFWADVDATYFHLSQDRDVMRLGGGVSFRF